MSGTKMKMLGATYDTIVRQFNLGRKSEFREKMGAIPDPQFIAWPPHGLGRKGISAVSATHITSSYIPMIYG